MWLDGIFMADSFYAKWTHLFDRNNMTAWNDILLQFTLLGTHTRNTTSNLLVHGWADPAKAAKWADPSTGLAPHVWGRADGWFFMALLETLQLFPRAHPGWRTLHEMFVNLADGVQMAQDEASGGWWQVMDAPYPGMKGNYIEASGSAMFTYGLLKGVHLGYLDSDKFLHTSKKAYKGLVKTFISVDENNVVHYNGTVQQCGLAVDDPSFEVSRAFLPWKCCHCHADCESSTTLASLLRWMTLRDLAHLCWPRMNGRPGPSTHKGIARDAIYDATLQNRLINPLSKLAADPYPS